MQRERGGRDSRKRKGVGRGREKEGKKWGGGNTVLKSQCAKQNSKKNHLLCPTLKRSYQAEEVKGVPGLTQHSKFLPAHGKTQANTTVMRTKPEKKETKLVLWGTGQ